MKRAVTGISNLPPLTSCRSRPSERPIPSAGESSPAALTAAVTALVPGITNPRRQRCEQVSHPTLEFTARANHVSMKVGTSSKSSRECIYRKELDMETLVWTPGRPSLSVPEIKSGRTDGVDLRGAGRPRCGQSPELHATLVHPCSAIGACARVIVISLVRSQQLAEVLLAEHHDMIKALPSDRADDFSVCPFCHGDRGAIGRSRMPIARRRRIKRSP